MSEYSQTALEILRQPEKTMQWYIIPIFLLVLYVITKELKAKNYNVLLGAVDIFESHGIEVITGASGKAEDAVNAYLKGALKSSGSICHEHAHADECGG